MLDVYKRGAINEAGHSVHVVAEAVDGGPIVATTPVPIEPTDDKEVLFDRIQTVEKAVTPYIPQQFLHKQRQLAS